MKTNIKGKTLEEKVFNATPETFDAIALEVFQFQFDQNPVYQQFCLLLNRHPANVSGIQQIPYLPINCFKTHTVVSGEFTAQVVFESSGTTQTLNSQHFVKSTSLYQRSFEKAFDRFYGSPANYCILGLLPSYLERSNSSLVMMVNQLVQSSNHPQSGFYLHNLAELKQVLATLEAEGQHTLLIGVTFALLDFAASYPMPLQHTIIMETGGMKGRRKEMTRTEVHDELCRAFQLQAVHSEYGMTELLSQAYSYGDGIFYTPPWLKIVLREEDDPFTLTSHPGKPIAGAINIIDLANIYSCSFIATEDAGRLYPDGSFEVLGRLDHADIRGCSLLAI